MNLNKAIIAGRLTRDPEGRVLTTGTTSASFSIATSRSYKDKDGARQEQTEFHNVVVFGAQADACVQYLKKGQLVAVSGRLQTQSWEKDGVKHYRTEIIADTVDFGPRASEAEPSIQTAAPSPKPEYPDEEISPEDIPF